MTESSAEGNGRIDAADLVQEQVRKEIIDGSLSPGERLTETNLAERFEVSRTPVREALVRLQADGFVELVRNRGAFVSKWTSEDLEEIFGLRIMLEGYGARVGAGKISPHQIAALETLADEMDVALEQLAGAIGVDDELREQSAERCATLNTQFHAGIVAAADNKRLSTIVANLTQLPLIHRTIIMQSPEELSHSWAQHRYMIEAMKIGDGEWAESLLRAHIQSGRAIMRRASADGRDLRNR
jgi:DNA-binding GntR family transcriptional regulator